MNYQQIIHNDLVNGPGIRVSLFVSGCTHNCHNCFNKKGQSFTAGKYLSIPAVNEIIKSLEQPHVQGLTLTGGDPFMFQHGKILQLIAKKAKLMGKDVWAWTGYEKEELTNHPLVQYCDVIVCGKFEQSLKTAGEWFGSTNQYLWRPRKENGK